MEDVLKLKIRFRRSTASDWTTKNPVLLSGEPAVETDTGKFKIGDGVKTWTALPYVGGGGTGDAPALILDHNQSPAAHLDIRDEIASKVDNADARLTDDRTPKPHNHVQSDVTGLSTALTTLTTSVASKVDNADARLTDDRTPKPHNHVQSDVTGLSTAYDHSQVVTGNPHGTTAADVGADPSGTAATAVTVHTADTTAVHGIADTSALVVTSDARLSDARTPLAHTHAAGDLVSGTVAAARLGTGAANNTTFLRGDGTWTAPASSLPGWFTDLAYSPLMGTAHCQIGGGGGVTIAFGADTLIMWRIMAVETVDIDGVMVMTQTAGGAGQQARFGIYSADVNGVPSGAAVVDSGAMSVSSAGTLLTSTFTAVRLQPYRPMWAAMLTSSAAVTFRFLASAASNSTPGQMLDTGIFNTSNNQIRRATGVTFGALPTAPSTAYTNSTNIIPGVFWRTRRV